MDTHDAALIALAGSDDFAKAFATAEHALPTGPMSADEEAWIRVHNAGGVNLVRRSCGDDVMALEPIYLYRFAQRLVRLIPTLDVSADGFAALIEAFAASRVHEGSILGGIVGWFRARPDEAGAVVERAKADDPVATRLLPLALSALGDVEGAVWFIEHNEGPQRLMGLSSLSGLPLDEMGAARALAIVDPLIASAPPDDVRAAVIDVLVHVQNRQPALADSVLGLLDRALIEGGPLTRYASAVGLLRSKTLMASGGRDAVLKALTQCRVDEQTTIGLFGSFVRESISGGFIDSAIDFCERWDDDGVLAVLLESLPPPELARVTVGWLVEGAPRRCALLGKYIGLRRPDDGEPLEPRFEVAPDLVPSDPVDRVLAAMRAMGWVILDPVTVAGVVIAFLRASSGEAVHHLKRLLANLVVDRPETEPYLRRFTADAAIGSTVSSVLAGHDAYIAALDKVVAVPELRPADEQRRIVQMLKQREAIDMARHARETSVIAQIATTQTLLHGTGAVHAVYDVDGTARQTTMQMHSYGFSVPLPRLGILDPIGDDMRLRGYRVVRRTS